MSYFDYKALDYSGQTIKGAINSASIEAASRDINAMGLYLVTINERDEKTSALMLSVRHVFIKKADIVEFAQSFSVMLNAGIPLLTSLEDIIASTQNKNLKAVLEDVKQMLECGSSLSAALEAQGKVFPDIIKTLVTVGEVTGRLDESLRDAAEHLVKMQNLSDSIKKALMYPAFAFTATIGALAFWFVFVIPQLTGTLKGLGVKLPAITVFLITGSTFFVQQWKLLLFGCIMTPVLFYIAGMIHDVRYYAGLIMLKLPVVKQIAYNKLLATFAEQFRILTAAGVGIEKLFGLLIPAMGNVYFGDKLLKVKDVIMNGRSISEAFKQHEILPSLALSKINVGETTGTLDKQFEFLAKYYSKKLDEATESMGKIIEPVVMAIIGGLFAVIIMGLLLPIYDLVSKVGKS